MHIATYWYLFWVHFFFLAKTYILIVGKINISSYLKYIVDY